MLKDIIPKESTEFITISYHYSRAPDKAHIFIPKNTHPNPTPDLLSESSHRDNSNKRPNIEYGQEMMELALIEVYFMHVIRSSVIP